MLKQEEYLPAAGMAMAGLLLLRWRFGEFLNGKG
jgi:hypothetical protein